MSAATYSVNYNIRGGKRQRRRVQLDEVLEPEDALEDIAGILATSHKPLKGDGKPHADQIEIRNVDLLGDYDVESFVRKGDDGRDFH